MLSLQLYRLVEGKVQMFMSLFKIILIKLPKSSLQQVARKVIIAYESIDRNKLPHEELIQKQLKIIVLYYARAWLLGSWLGPVFRGHNAQTTDATERQTEGDRRRPKETTSTGE